MSTKNIPWRGIGILASAFACIVLFFVFYCIVYRLVMVDVNMACALNKLHREVQQLQARLTDLDHSQTKIEQLSQTVSNQQQIIDEIKRAQLGNKNEWVIDEARYLVKLANHHLQFENNIPVAISLLQNADRALAELHDDKLTPLREALAKDIAQLQSLPQIDWQAYYLRLLALNGQVDALPLMQKPDVVYAKTDNNNNQDKQPWWQRSLHETGLMLQKIVIIRYDANKSPALLTPDERVFLYQNLHAALEKAMWAVLYKQTDIYQTSLKQAIDWIKHYFVQDSSLTQSMLTQLTELQQININPVAAVTLISLSAFDTASNSSKH